MEICIAKALPDGTTSVYTQRFNPTIPIPLESSLIHGIYDPDVADLPPFKAGAKEIARLLDGCDLGGFNLIRFDVPLLTEEFTRANVPFSLEGRRIVDVQQIFHRMEPRSLTAAYRFYCGEELENAHSAEADTLATLRVLDAQVQRYQGVKIKDSQGTEYEPVKNDVDALHEIGLGPRPALDSAARFVLNSKGEEVINFGQFTGRLVSEILVEVPGFYEWMMKGDFPADTKRKLTEIRLRGFGTKR